MNSLSQDGSAINIVTNKTGQDLFNKIINNSKPLKYFFDVYKWYQP